MDAIADHVWQSTIVAAAAGALALMFRNNSASVRYWIWFAAALKFLVPFAVLTAAADRLPLPQAPAAAGAALDAASLVFRASTVPRISDGTATFLFPFWLLTAAVALARSAWQWHRLATNARHASPITTGVVFDSLRCAERAERVARPTRLVSAPGTMEPGVFGIRRPVLMWPLHLTTKLSDAEVESVVAHEVCHIVRRDNLLATVQILVNALFWFHPLVWLISSRLIAERERACDERVLASGRRPAAYAESILKTCRLCIASPLVSVPGVTGGDLTQRIMRIMRNERSRPVNTARKGALLVGALVLLLLPTAAGVSACRSDSGTGTRTGQPAPIEPSPQNAGTEVNRPGGNVSAPRLVRETKPQYTPRALQEKVQGEVLMECVVKADGTVGETKIVKPLHPDLDRAALDAARQWTFEPGTRNGKPVDVLVTIAMAFTLK